MSVTLDEEILSLMGSLPAGAGCVLVKEQLEVESGGLFVDGIVDMPLVQGRTRPEEEVVGRIVLDEEGSESRGNGRRYSCRYGRHGGVREGAAGLGPGHGHHHGGEGRHAASAVGPRSRSGIPVGCPGWDSNPHWTVFETASSAGWDTGA